MFLPKFLTQRLAHRSFSIGGKLALLFAICFLLFAVSSKPLHAFSTSNSTYQFQFEQAVFKTQEMNLQSFVYETLKAVAGSVVTTNTGCLSCTPEERGQNAGLLMGINNLIVSIYGSPPASGIKYVADIGNRIGITTPVYAQERGVGFDIMNTILPIWKAFRDVSYVFFVLIFIFIGFAIMFRVKISPQAVITIQSALPKIILALILITFSYAIVGFLIDLAFILTLLIGSVFRGILLGRIAFLLGVSRDALRPFEAFLFGSEPILSMAQTAKYYVWASLAPTIIAILLFVFLGMIVGGAFTSWSGPGAALGATIGGVIFALLLVIILLFVLIRCLWTLLRAFIQIILALVFAPFQILAGVLPGSNATSSWLRNLISNLAVFPAMITMFFLATYFSFEWTVKFLQITANELGKNWVERLIGILSIAFSPLKTLMWTGQALGFFLLPFIALGILFMAPKVADMIQAFLAGKPFGYGAAIGEAIPGLAFGRKAAEEYIIKQEIMGGREGAPFPGTRKLIEKAGARLRPRVSEEVPLTEE